MAAFMDLIFSMTLGGMIMLIVMTSNEIVSENQSVYNGDMLVQEMLTSTAEILEGEIRNMGYGVSENQSAITAADTSSITFLTDLRDGGTNPDVISYALGGTADLANTQNEQDKILYRSVNNATATQVGVVTLFHLSYITHSGEVLDTPVDPGRLSEIHVVEVTMEVQNPYAPYRSDGAVANGERTALFSSSIWQQTRLASQNSRR